jgi:signal-transduction protein with cAMP-binding, CBS, and nucleotidyltransferase domain
VTAPGLALFTGRVASAMRPAPPLVAPESGLAAAVAAMAAAGETCVVAVDAAGRAVGILTERDVVRRVAFRAGPDDPVAQAMSAPVRTVPAEEHLYRAVGLMRARGHRHLVVVDAAGRPIGTLRRVDAYAAASARLLAAVETLARGDDEAGFAATRAAQAGLARTLLDEDVPAADVIGVVSEINLDIHRRVVERALGAAGAPPPVPFTLLVMGSGGRGESLLAPDQDNGLILADYPDARHGEVDAWFIPFAEDLNARLDAAGFPLCKGHVMARNPVWRKTLAQWQAQLGLWAERRSPVALLFGDIAFDFRPVWGEPAPAETLRAHLARTLAAHPAFLAALAAEDAKLTVGLSFWGGFRDDERGPGARTDLKRSGLMPLVSSVRLLALKHGVAATGTRARLAALAAAGAVRAEEAQTLGAAFETLAGALLRQQLDDAARGRPPGTLVDLRARPRAEQAAIRAAMKRVAAFQTEVKSAFGGGLW